jgi:hypothetical protein
MCRSPTLEGITPPGAAYGGLVAYDALAESVRLIENGVPGSVASRVSRRVRHIPLAVDRDGAIAATMFLRRGQGQVWRESHVLVQRHGSWRVEGGGGGTGGETAAHDAPGYEDLGGYLDVDGSGALHFDSTTPALPRIVRYAGLRAAREVRTVIIADREVLVPRHGWLIAVWPDPHAPHLTAVDEVGVVLATGDASAWPSTRPPRPRSVGRLPSVYTDDFRC